MKIIIAGGSGQVGTILCRAFHASGDEVVSLSRSPRKTPWKTAVWDARTIGPWASELDGANVIINLAGRSVNCRYGRANRREIIDSRVDSARVVGEAIAASPRPPKTWLQASTATICAHRYDAANTGIHRHPRRKRARRAGDMAFQHRRRQGLGTRHGPG